MRRIKFITQKEYSELLETSKWESVLREARNFEFNYFYLKINDKIEDQKLKEFLDLVSSFNFIVEVEDNNIWDDVRKEIFLNSNIDFFWITFYGGDDYQSILDKIEYLRGKNLPWGLRYVLSKRSFQDVFNLPKIIHSLPYAPKQVIIEEISPSEQGRFREDILIDQEQLKLYSPYLKKYIPDVKIYSNYQNEKYPSFISGQEIVIEPNGDIRPMPFFSPQKIGNVFSDSFTKIHNDLAEALNGLVLKSVEQGEFLNWSHVFSKKLEVCYQDIDRVILPDTFNILMTKKCNFNCDFCEFDCKPEDNEAIDIKDFEKLLVEGKRLGVKRIAFDGGEPLLHPDIKTAFKIAKTLNYQTVVLTNGWHFKEFLEDFKENNIKEFIFGLFGASAKVHDAIVGREGAFDRCIAAIKLAKELGYAARIHTVLHPLNFPELDKFFDLTRALNVDYIMVSPIIPIGRAENNRNLLLGGVQKEQIPVIYGRHGEFLFRKNFFSGYRPSEGRDLSCKYLICSGPLGVYWDGSVAICSMMPLLNLPFPKIRDKSLIDCLISMNKIIRQFQSEGRREFLHWHLGEKEVRACVYCHEKLSRDIKKYLQ